MFDIPPVAVFNITFRCQLKCKICNIENTTANRSELSTEQAVAILKDLSSNGISTIDFVGGEVLVRNDVKEILKTARALFKQVRLVTNGLLGLEYLEFFLDLPLDHISISLDGSQSETHDSLRGKGVFNKVVDFLRQMKEDKGRDSKPLTTINTVIVKNNIAELVDIMELADSLHVNNITYEVFLLDNSNLNSQGSVSPFWIQGNDLQRLDSQIKEIIAIKKARSMTICVASTAAYLRSIVNYYADTLEPNLFTCRNGLDFITIAADGRVCICDQVIGIEPQENFLKIWNGEKAKQALKSVARCAKPCMMNCMVGGVEYHGREE